MKINCDASSTRKGSVVGIVLRDSTDEVIEICYYRLPFVTDNNEAESIGLWLALRQSEDYFPTNVVLCSDSHYATKMYSLLYNPVVTLPRALTCVQQIRSLIERNPGTHYTVLRVDRGQHHQQLADWVSKLRLPVNVTWRGDQVRRLLESYDRERLCKR